jgi:hypothetical protein
MHRVPRILLVVAVAGVLAMHGVDATTTARHAAAAPNAAAAEHDMHAFEPVTLAAADTSGEHQNDRAGHHVVMLCIAALVGALGFAGRRLLVRLADATVTRIELAVLNVSERVDEILRPPPPAWVRLCVLRR